MNKESKDWKILVMEFIDEPKVTPTYLWKCIFETYTFITAVLLRGLDALSTEDAVLNCMMRHTDLPLKSVRIGKPNN